jgi:GNAT superfamily N-acetyltransferase
VIRVAERRADLELCVAINNAVNPDSPVTADQLDVSSGAFIVAGADGYAYVDRSSVPGAAFAMVRVRQESRRRGVGATLLAAARRRARELEYQSMWGRVREGDAAMRAVNERLGYEPLPAWIVVRGPA